MKEFKHIIRYGTAQDTQFIKEHAKTYDLVALNANLLCHHSKNISRTIYVDFNNIDYFIEPQIHKYQDDLNYIKDKNQKIKKSYKNLANYYNLDYVIEQNQQLVTEELKNNKIDELINNIFNFQQNCVFDNLTEELKEFSSLSGLKKEPAFLVIPSFYIKEPKDAKWYSINIKFIQKAFELKNQYNQKKMYANLIISKDILNNKKFIDDILCDYATADGLLFWIDNFNELTVEKETIEALIYFIQTYKKQNPMKEIISLYGGYFQEILNHIGLNGVCHSVAYGEMKAVCSLGGAPVVQKYYMPNLFQRMKPESMIKLIYNLNLKTKEEFYKKVCGCKVCKNVIYDNSIHNRFLTYLDAIDDNKNSRNNARINSIKHFLEVKNNEFRNVTEKDFHFLVEELQDIYNEYHNNAYINIQEIHYLLKWYQSLKKHINIKLLH